MGTVITWRNLPAKLGLEKEFEVSLRRLRGQNADITAEAAEIQGNHMSTNASDDGIYYAYYVGCLSDALSRIYTTIDVNIEVGDVICEIETDKATLEHECLEEGFLAKILAPEGSKDIAVGQAIAITVEDPKDIEAVKNSITGNLPVKEGKSTSQEAKTEANKLKSGFSRISPSAKLLITEHGLDASSLLASGPRGTLLKGDVLDAIKSGKGSARTSSAVKKSPPQVQPQTSSSASESVGTRKQQSDSFEDQPNSQIRKVIAKKLLESKQNTPHLYLSSDVILDPLISFRKGLKEKYNVKVSVNDIVIKAVAIALKNVPEANAF